MQFTLAKLPPPLEVSIFEAPAPHTQAATAYVPTDDGWILYHTEVAESAGGRGVE